MLSIRRSMILIPKSNKSRLLINNSRPQQKLLLMLTMLINLVLV
jgi:hypothetical protein